MITKEKRKKVKLKANIYNLKNQAIEGTRLMNQAIEKTKNKIKL